MKDILKLSKKLFRGIDDNFKPNATYNEKGFLATSLQKHVAVSFATAGKRNGFLQIFKVSKLPVDIPFVLIDEKINSIFQESEILMLPGTISQVKNINTNKNTNIDEIQVTYTPDIEFINYIKNKPLPILKKKKGGSNMFELEHTLKDLCGKDIVYYRAIYKRNPDVLCVLHCPKNIKDLPKFLKEDFHKVNRYYDGVLSLIPEVQDLQEYMKTATHSRKTSYKAKILMSYSPHTAIYDPINKKIITLNGLMPTEIYKEIVPQGRDTDIMNAIHTYYNNMHMQN